MTPPSKRNITRVRSGCWTCKTRRKKCDEGRPHCQTCRGLGLVCEGYGLRLRWAGLGKRRVAFSPRHRYRRGTASVIGRDASDLGSEPARPGEPDRTATLLLYLGREIFDQLSELERNVLYDFADWGEATLVARTTPGPPDRFDCLTCCAESKPMMLNCLTYQMTLDPKYAKYVHEYYARSIAQFRETLSDPKWIEDESAPFAGVLLSVISANLAMPFTIHLNGLTAIFLEQGYFDHETEDSRELAALIGVLELPTHILGRQSECMHLWKRYCKDQTGIEEVTGLPCDLLHIFAATTDPQAEDRLLQWSPHAENPATCKLWDATRYAGLIMVREFCRDQAIEVKYDSAMDAWALKWTMVNLRAIRPQMDQDALVNWDGMLFPLVAAGSQTAFLTPEDRLFIRECICTLAESMSGGQPYYNAILTTLDTLWEKGNTRSLHQVTRDLGLEIGL